MNKINYLKKLLSVIGKKEYTEKDMISIFELVFGEEEKETTIEFKSTDVEPMLDAIKNMAKTPLKGDANLVSVEKE